MSVCQSAVLMLWLSVVTLCDPRAHASSSQKNIGLSPDVLGAKSSDSAIVSQLNDSLILQIRSPPNAPYSQSSSSPFESLPWKNGPKSMYPNGSPSPSPSPSTSVSQHYEEDHNRWSRPKSLKSDRPSASIKIMGIGSILAKGTPSSLQEMGNDDSSTSEEDLVLKLDRNYTPKEIADYIVSTGDEQGISQAIADMIQDGQLMASRDDVIRFLEAVQLELSHLRSQEKQFLALRRTTKDLDDDDHHDHDSRGS